MNKKFKHILFSCATFLMVAIVIFLIGEICFRIFRGPPNPLSKIIQEDSGYLLKPNMTKRGQSSIAGEFDYTAHYNNYGYRGKDFQMPKVKGKVRIFAVGDSFTYGVGAEENETIPFLIEENLNEKGFNTEVINAGIGHASPIKHYMNLRDMHLQYKPDLVVLLLDLTDLWDDWHTERMAIFNDDGEIVRFDGTYKYGKKDWWDTATRYSAFCKYIHNKAVRSFQKLRLLGFKNYSRIAKEGKRAKAAIANSPPGQFSDETIISYDGLLFLRGRQRKSLIDKNWVRTAKYLTKIKELLRERDIPLVLVMYPYGIYIGKDQWSEGRLLWGFEGDKVYTDHYAFEVVADYAAKEGIPFINTLRNFPINSDKKFFFDWDGHMTPAGNKIVAQAIANNPSLIQLMNAISANP